MSEELATAPREATNGMAYNCPFQSRHWTPGPYVPCQDCVPVRRALLRAYHEAPLGQMRLFRLESVATDSLGFTTLHADYSGEDMEGESMYYSVPVAKFAYQTSDDKERADYILKAANAHDSNQREIEQLRAALAALIEWEDSSPITSGMDGEEWIERGEQVKIAARAALTPKEGEANDER